MPQQVAERRLGTWPIFVIAVSAMTPLTVVAGALPLGYGQVEEKGIPVAYMLVAAVLGVFAVGLAAMARHVPNSGAFYAYAAAGLSRPAGVGTAFVALLAYNAMQIGLYGAFGVAAHNAMAIFGIQVSWVIWALLGWALIGVLGRLNIDLNARILTVLVCAEVLIVLVFDYVMVTHPAGGTVSFGTLNPGLIASAGGVALLVAAVAGMVGFEAPLVYAAEARDPRRTVSRAIGLTLLVAAVLYGGTAWVMSVVAGYDQIVAIAGDHLDDLFFYLPDPYLPSVIIDLGRIFFATSLFAAMLAFHHTVARYALTVAREGVLPPSLARTRGGVPVTASFAQSSVALGVLLLFALVGWNPTTDLFFFGTVSGGLGVLVLMVIASIAVVRYFRRGDHGETRWRRAVAPWISVVFLSLILLLTVASFGILLDSDNLLKVWSPPLAFLILFVVGVRWGRKLRRWRPEVYAVIGSGQPPAYGPSSQEALDEEARESGDLDADEPAEPEPELQETADRGAEEEAEGAIGAKDSPPLIAAPSEPRSENGASVEPRSEDAALREPRSEDAALREPRSENGASATSGQNAASPRIPQARSAPDAMTPDAMTPDAMTPDAVTPDDPAGTGAAPKPARAPRTPRQRSPRARRPDAPNPAEADRPED
ncbi:putative amino acid permease [Actinoplanes missouriensis 431]|uniref:Putative amino acid permease n=1 Tax=Actinoplanes missouriensis (strain ATCC 14538 / DSM 43046 / CBS 188.64 / JCM 3121 / NBRC 102363 / NCIMB 12654 / NRRL B-3342 / UNCC 431) TaxID=512565 RepID=I0HAW2_ACTM4|nr:APC family permease [Actinoplanes missouriensis]BAL90149.1 putative amino acid permease [Actinoplanes missouriensis 431]